MAGMSMGLNLSQVRIIVNPVFPFLFLFALHLFRLKLVLDFLFYTSLLILLSSGLNLLQIQVLLFNVLS